MPSKQNLAVVAIVALAVVGAGIFGLGSFGAEPSNSTADQPSNSTVNQRVTLQLADVPGSLETDEETILSVTVNGSNASSSLAVRAVPEAIDNEPLTLAQRTANLSGPNPKEIEFSVSGEDLSAGEYRLMLISDTREIELGMLTVRQPPTLAIESADSQVEVVYDQTAQLSAQISNVGDYEGPATVELAVDRDDDGTTTQDSAVLNESFSLDSGESVRAQLTVSPAAQDLAPGEYTYHLRTDADTVAGSLTVLAPAEMQIRELNASTNVTLGENVTLTTTVHNVGDVAGNGTLAVTQGDQQVERANMSLPGGERTTMEFTVPTQGLERGNYTYAVSTQQQTTNTTVRVREPRFEVSNIRGNDTLTIGDPMIFAANITNTGDAPGTATVAYRIDLDDDDRPERDNITQRVMLAPGEQQAVQFRVPYLEDPNPLNQVSTLPPGTYIYGIYTADDNETSVFDARRPSRSGGFSSGSSTGSDGGSLEASRDEISQEKYGLYYDDLSEETQGQIAEIHERQPFADDLSLTQVLTREEIAIQNYGLDVQPGDEFDFTSIDVEIQQDIEADFDAQFESDEGDRVESWEELAQKRYDTSFEALNESRQSTIKTEYWDQFESS